MFYNNNKVRRLHLPTNGYATKKIINDTTRMLNELPDLEINIGVSIDALYEKHDHISKKSGAFTKAMETQRLLIELEKKVLIMKEMYLQILFCHIVNSFSFEE